MLLQELILDVFSVVGSQILFHGNSYRSPDFFLVCSKATWVCSYHLSLRGVQTVFTGCLKMTCFETEG